MHRCLVVGPAWVGDMVMAQSLFITLKAQQPDLHLGVLAPSWSGPLLARMPQVDEVFDLPVKHNRLAIKPRWQAAKTIKQAHYDQAIVLQRSYKSALVPFFARIAKRTGYLGEQRYGLLNDIRSLNKQALPMNVQRFLALANDEGKLPNSLPKPSLQSNVADQKAVCAAFKLRGAPLLALCPGAEFGVAKQWPAQHYANVAMSKIAEGWQVVLLGSQADHNIAEEINKQCQQSAVNLAGKTSLTQVIDLLASADAVVSNDSGLMHIAAALSRPLVAVYGSSSPDFTPPLSANSHIAKLDLSCQPCFERNCPLKHLNCLNQLSPEAVLAHLA